MAIEIFLKAYLSVKKNFTDKETKDINHKLGIAVNLCIELGLNDLESTRTYISELPRIDARYEAHEKVFGELWGAYKKALFVGTTALRDLTGRDCRKAVR